MFGNISEKLSKVFSNLARTKKINEDNISEAVREVRLALLDADVNYNVVKNLIKKVKEKALGDEVLKSVTPAQQFIKIVHDELVALMGGGEAKLSFTGKTSVLMLVGLQGTGKTTQAAKLANYIRKKEQNKRPILVACDLKRPAAVLQLKTLATEIGIPFFSIEGEKNPLVVAKAGLKHAEAIGCNVCIIDTAGRLHIDEELMDELVSLKKALLPEEILFVAPATLGQDAVKTATEFNQRLEISGAILTMVDSEARAGAALSILEVTGKPIKFEGVGEKVDDLQLFDARSCADRILGMGDTINLVKKAEEVISEEEVEKLEEKMRKASFTYEDYLKQMQAVKKMGSLKKLMKMLPGASKFADFDLPEKDFFKIESIILSMTPRERQEKDDITLGRAKRIARGSGTEISDVNKLKKSFTRSKDFFKHMSNNKKFEKMQGDLWR